MLPTGTFHCWCSLTRSQGDFQFLEVSTSRRETPYSIGERGHALMLAHLRAEPLLDLGLRLGEGSCAALAWPLLVSACAQLD